MKYLTINNRKVGFTDEKNLLSIIRKAGIDIPTFCYHSHLSTYGACRMCVVEDDRGRILATCSETPREGMVLFTNTPRLRQYRKTILELLLASHDRDCTTCHSNNDCTLQKLAHQLGVREVRFENNKPQVELDDSSPSVVINPNKCILCGDCVRTCSEIQGLGILDFSNRGSKAEVTTAFHKKMSETQCVGCGQCRVVCPTGAITIKTNVSQIWEDLADPNKRVIAQIAPAVRIAIGDKFGIPKGTNSAGQLTAALHRMGFDEVYDTNFAADLTVVEEGNEFLEKFEKGELPLFTSCCPAWVKFCEEKHPKLAKHISSCRSPQSMFGAVLREQARMNEDKDSRETIIVSIMPCTAKKGEILRPDQFNHGKQNIDHVLTTAELSRMIKEGGIDLAQMPSEAMEMPFGIASGAAAIFGLTGGVTEAVLRYLTQSVSMPELEAISILGIRGDDRIKEAEIEFKGKVLHIAVVSGLKFADEIMNKIESGEAHYDFVEVMACRRGCIAGGGQPRPIGPRTKAARLEGLYEIDRNSQIKMSSGNPAITTIYQSDILKGKEYELLHCHK